MKYKAYRYQQGLREANVMGKRTKIHWIAQRKLLCENASLNFKNEEFRRMAQFERVFLQAR